jgi:hypothetical protein
MAARTATATATELTTRTRTTELAPRTSTEAGRRVGLRRSICAAAAALTLAGCGGGDDRLSKSEYEEKVRAVYADVQEAFQATAVTRPTELAARIEDAQRELREAADELDEVEPPEDVEAENRQIVEGMRRYADSLDRLRNAAERGDTEVIDDATARIGQNEAVEQIAESAERMKFKGYDLGPIAEE